MDLLEIKQEQQKLARRVQVRDGFDSIKTIGGAACSARGDELIAVVVVCSLPDLKVIEKKSYVLPNPLPFRMGFSAYREMPAIIEAYNQLEQEPDILLVKGAGIAHPRNFGIASHTGLVLNTPTIGVTDKLLFGNVNEGKILINANMVGFEVTTREYSNPIYVSPGHLVSLGACLNIISKTIQLPHKIPEPLHIALKIAKKKAKKIIA